MLKIKDNSYITIESFMRTDMNLTGVELMCFAVIYGFSQDGTAKYKGGISYLVEWTGATKKTVITALKNLTNKEFVTRHESKINNVCVVDYSVKITRGVVQNLHEGSVKITRGVVQNLHEGSVKITRGVVQNLHPDTLKNILQVNITNNSKEKNENQNLQIPLEVEEDIFFKKIKSVTRDLEEENEMPDWVKAKLEERKIEIEKQIFAASDFFEQIKADENFLNTSAKNNQIQKSEILNYFLEFENFEKLNGEPPLRLSDLKRHFSMWLPKYKKIKEQAIKQKENKFNNQTNFKNARKSSHYISDFSQSPNA